MHITFIHYSTATQHVEKGRYIVAKNMKENRYKGTKFRLTKHGNVSAIKANIFLAKRIVVKIIIIVYFIFSRLIFILKIVFSQKGIRERIRY
jgi:hypothetical protein